VQLQVLISVEMYCFDVDVYSMILLKLQEPET
jgi:hypothetical protein